MLSYRRQVKIPPMMSSFPICNVQEFQSSAADESRAEHYSAPPEPARLKCEAEESLEPVLPHSAVELRSGRSHAIYSEQSE